MRERCEGNGPVEIDREKDGDDQRRGVEGGGGNCEGCEGAE